MVAGMLIYWLWEAMLISYFSLPNIALPFNSMEELVTKSNLKVNIKYLIDDNDDLYKLQFMAIYEETIIAIYFSS